MGKLWMVSLAFVLLLGSLCLGDTANETATEILEEEEYLPEAAPLTSDQDWFDSQKVKDDDEMMEDDGIEDEKEDIDTAGSEVVSTVVKHDDGEVSGEASPKRPRKKGRKRRRRLRKRPRTTTPSSPTEEGEIYPTSAGSEVEEYHEKAPFKPEEKVVSDPSEGDQVTYPRRRPGKRRRRPWKRPAEEEANQNQDNQETLNNNNESQVPEDVSTQSTPRRRKRPKYRNQVRQEVQETETPNKITEEVQLRDGTKDGEPLASLPENHKQYEDTKNKIKESESFNPTNKPTVNSNLNSEVLLTHVEPRAKKPGSYSFQNNKDNTWQNNEGEYSPKSYEKPSHVHHQETSRITVPTTENPSNEPKQKIPQNFIQPTNKPYSNQQQNPLQTYKAADFNYSNERNKQPIIPSTSQITITPKTNEYDGFHQFQKHYFNDHNFNQTQIGRLKEQETQNKGYKTQSHVLTQNQNENTDISQQDKFQKYEIQSFNKHQQANLSIPNKLSNGNNFNNYGHGQVHKPTLGSLLHPPMETNFDQEVQNKFPQQQRPQSTNIPQNNLQYSRQKEIKENNNANSSFQHSVNSLGKTQGENSFHQNRPQESTYPLYVRPQNTKNYQPNPNPSQESINIVPRNKGNNAPNTNSEDYSKNIKPDSTLQSGPVKINKVPHPHQQNLFKQNNQQSILQSTFQVADTNVATAPKALLINNVNDLSAKLKPTQSIDQFNQQFIDPTLLTSPVLFEPQAPPIFQDDVVSTKATQQNSKIQVPSGISFPRSKLQPTPFQPPSQKQLPNTQFQRQAEPAPFRLPTQNTVQQLQQLTLPTQGQPFKQNLPSTVPTLHSQDKQSQNKNLNAQVIPTQEGTNEEVNLLVSTNNVIPHPKTHEHPATSTTAPELPVDDIETQTPKVSTESTPNPRKSLFSHSKRLPPTSAIIRRKIRPRIHKNSTNTETTETTTLENKENSRDTNRIMESRIKNNYRQHLTEVKPTTLNPDLESDSYPQGDLSKTVQSDSKLSNNDGVNKKANNFENQDTKPYRYSQKHRSTTTLSPVVDNTPSKQGRFGLHHTSAQQEILRQTLQKQAGNTEENSDIEESTQPHFITYKPTEEREIIKTYTQENQQPVFTNSKKSHGFTPSKPSHRYRTHVTEDVKVSAPSTHKYTTLEIITDRPQYSEADEYEFMVSDEELLSMMKPMMGDDSSDIRKDSEDLKFKAANIHGVKDEILDLIKTDTGSTRLSKILKLRNMSLDDLIKHRERGSSQLHLSDIFNRTQKKQYTPEPSYNPKPTERFTELRESYVQNSHSNATQPTTIFEFNFVQNKTETETKIIQPTFTETPTETILNNNYQNRDSVKIDNEKINNREPKVFESMPSFTLRTDIIEKLNKKKENLPTPSDSNWRFFGQISKTEQTRKPSYEDVIISYTSTNRYPYRKPAVDEIDDIILLSDAEQYDVPRSNVIHAKVLAESGERKDQEFYIETKKLSTGVKSAIIVSGAIIGIAVLGFFALMISCRIKQKKARMKARRDILCDHFHNEELRSSARSTSPVMAHRPEENTCEHGVRSTAIPTRHYNNRHYYLWRTLRKTFQYE